jgi:hypothetical protein
VLRSRVRLARLTAEPLDRMRMQEKEGMTREELHARELELLWERDRLMRSQVIYEAIDLESAVERIILFHFCPDAARHDLFISLLFRDGEVSFSQKIKMLRKLLKLCYPKLSAAFAFLPTHLDKLRRLRNDFAHLPLDLPAEPGSSDLRAEEVRLRSVKDGARITHGVAQDQVNRVVEQCRDLTMAAVFLAMATRKGGTGQADDEFTNMIAELGEQIGERVRKKVSAV